MNIRGKAEDTTPGDASIGLVTVGQAIHWFDREPATREFTRILRKNGQLGVVYNDRNKKDPFMQSYEAIIEKHARDRAWSRMFWRSGPCQEDHLSKYFQNGN